MSETKTKFDEVTAGDVVLITKRGEMPKTANVARVTKTQIHVHVRFSGGSFDQLLIFSRREGDICNEFGSSAVKMEDRPPSYLEPKTTYSRFPRASAIRMYLYSIEMLERQQGRCELEVTELAKRNVKKEEQREATKQQGGD